MADAVRKGKEDFYETYPYLKPEGEKNGWERMCGYLQTAGEWCREHWKLIETVVVVLCAVVLLLSGVGAILAGMCLGTIFGAVLGGLSGGLESLSRGRPFMEGFEEGANAGAKRGALMGTFFGLLGAVGGLLGLGIGSATKLGMAIKGTAAVTGALSIGMGSFDLLALLDMAVDNGHNPVAEANRKLHSYKIYNIFQFTVTAVAVFTGSMASTMPRGESGLEGCSDVYAAPSGGGGITSTIKVNGQTVNFGHGGRHLEGTSLNVNAVNQALANEVSTLNLRIGQFHKGQIVVDEVTIEYTSYGVSDGIINVGTYYPLE